MTDWEWAASRLETADTYWLTTTMPDGRPHVAPLLAVWLDGAPYFSAGPGTRKARNLAAEPRCVLTTRHDGLDLVVEGTAAPVRDAATLRRIREIYLTKYDWPTEVGDGVLRGDGAPTAAAGPYDVYRVETTSVLGFGWDASVPPGSWRFEPVPH